MYNRIVETKNAVADAPQRLNTRGKDTKLIFLRYRRWGTAENGRQKPSGSE
jgi:hypothetical protein